MGFDYDLLVKLVRDVPDNLDWDKEKEKVPKNVDVRVRVRDGNRCRLCGRGGDGERRLIVHHIIPNGNAEMDNLILLCGRCHAVVHELLAIAGKWKKVGRFGRFGGW